MQATSNNPFQPANPFLPAGGIQQQGPTSFGYGPEDYNPSDQQQQCQQTGGYGHYNSQY